MSLEDSFLEFRGLQENMKPSVGTSLPDADWRFAKIEAFYNGEDDPGVTLSEEESEMLRDVGFRSGYSSGGEFLDALVARFQEITQAPLPI